MNSLYDKEKEVRSDVGGMVIVFAIATLPIDDDFLYERYGWS